jgi:hypothetical protein
MRDREANTRKGTTAPTTDGKVTVELSASEVELLTFLRGQEKQPGAPVLLNNLTDMLQMVLDDQLLEALKATEETYLYANEDAANYTGAHLKAIRPQRDLIGELERYQKSRLRAALANTLQPSDC